MDYFALFYMQIRFQEWKKLSFPFWMDVIRLAQSCLTLWKISRGLSDSMDPLGLKSVAQRIKAIKTKQKSLKWLLFGHVTFTKAQIFLSVRSPEGVNKSFQENKCISKISNKSTRKRCKICSKLTLRHHSLCS